MATYTLISSNVLTASAASVTFSSIPATYTDLVLRVSARDDSATVQQQFLLRLNGDTSSLYSITYLEGNGSAASSGNQAASYIGRTPVVGASATSNTFNNAEFYIPSYTAAQNKPISVFGASETNATAAQIDAIAGLYRSSTAISSLTALCAGAAQFVSGSSFYLYGISNA
jgi:hypothetical protein